MAKRKATTRKRQDAQGRWRDARGHFTSPPKRAGRKPKPKQETVIIYGIGQALQELSKRGVRWTYQGPASVPLAPAKAPEKPLPQSGKTPPKPAPEKSDEALFEFRGGKSHIDIEQDRPDLDAIKRWIVEWNAEWHRNRNGSYQAMVSIAEDEEPEDGDDDALDTLQTAALQVPGPALIRFGVWHRADDEHLQDIAKWGSPKPFVTGDDDEGETITLVQTLTPLVREYNAANSLSWAYKYGHPEPDRGSLQVMWPSPKRKGE